MTRRLLSLAVRACTVALLAVVFVAAGPAEVEPDDVPAGGAFPGGLAPGRWIPAAPAAEPGELELTSSPEGALVYVGGVLRGRTPITLRTANLGIEFGMAQPRVPVRFEMRDRAVVERTAILAKTQGVKVHADLPAAAWGEIVVPGAPPALRIRRRAGDTWARTWDVAKGVARLAPWDGRVPPGKVEVELRMPGARPQRHTVDVAPGAQVPVTPLPFTPADPLLDLRDVPGDTVVLLDGKPVRLAQRVPAGKHVLLLRRPTREDGGPKDETKWTFEVTAATTRVRPPRTYASPTEIEAAVAWLLRHPSLDGHWDPKAFGGTCGCPGAATSGESAVGVTALATLAAAGTLELGTPEDQKIRLAAVRRAATWLVERTATPATTRAAAFERAFALQAIAEVHGVTGDASLRAAVQTLTDRIEAARNPGAGWRYGTAPDGQNDSAVTGVTVLALHAAWLSGATVRPETFEDALAWLDGATDAATGETGYTVRGVGLAYANARSPGGSRWTCTALAGLARLARAEFEADGEDLEPPQVALGAPRPGWTRQLFDRAPLAGKALEVVAANAPDPRAPAAKTDFLHVWSGTRLVLAAGGERREAWPDPTAGFARIRAKEGHAVGSYYPADRWGAVGGRVAATALLALTLEAAEAR